MRHLLVPSLFLALFSLSGQCDEVVFEEDFNEVSDSILYQKIRKHQRVEIDEAGGPDGSPAVKVSYVPSKDGSERIALFAPLKRSGIEFSLSYDVKFDREFEFVRGGKLPGLGPDNWITGGRPGSPDGWSARIMWHKEARLVSYLYHQNQPDRTGDSRRSERFSFRGGRYQSVTIHLKLNTKPKKDDGFVQIYVDGDKVLEHKEVVFRNESGANSEISHLLFHTFHGGSDSSWSPKRTVYAWFDNIEVTKGKMIRSRPKK